MIPFKASQVRSYILAGRLLHIITVLELMLIILLLPLIFKMDTNGSIMMILIKLYLAGYIISLPVFSQLDARSRYQNYKQIKDQFFIYGFQARILQPVLKSRCQRDAALVSAMELGMHDKCYAFFRKHGYRWYHLLPDFAFRKPQILLTKYFWKTTFFASTYRAKIDFNKMDELQIKSRLV